MATLSNYHCLLPLPTPGQAKPLPPQGSVLLAAPPSCLLFLWLARVHLHAQPQRRSVKRSFQTHVSDLHPGPTASAWTSTYTRHAQH